MIERTLVSPDGESSLSLEPIRRIDAAPSLRFKIEHLSGGSSITVSSDAAMMIAAAIVRAVHGDPP